MKRSKPSVQQYRALLREAGLRTTGPRVAVLEMLEKATAPLSHGDIAEALADSTFDKATLYRNLVDLADAGIVTRSDLGDHVWRFELRRADAQRGHSHPHFVCRECGGVSCLSGAVVRLHGVAGAPRAIGKKDVEVQLKGVCDRCA
jgi:Fur family ferric uptake transcriptional regulator